jgi:hypothetical protein
VQQQHRAGEKLDSSGVEKTKIAIITTKDDPTIEEAAILGLFSVNIPQLSLLIKKDENHTKAIDEARAEGAKLVIGPLAGRQASKSGMLTIATNVSYGRDPGIIKMNVLSEENIKQIIRHSINQGFKEFYAILPNGEYGSAIAKMLRKTISDADHVLGKIEFYDQQYNIHQVLGSASNIAETLLIIVETHSHFERSRHPSVLYVDLAINPLSSNSLSIENADQQHDVFVQNFQQAYGHKPSRDAEITYDAILVAAQMVRSNEFAVGALGDHKFYGITGSFSFDKEGNIERELMIRDVQEQD